MTFTDLTFLLGFLPLSWLLYQPVEKKGYGNPYLLAVSLLFYAWGSLSSLLVLLIVLGWNFLGARQIRNAKTQKERKTQLILCVAVDLFFLFFYRYLGLWFGFLDPILHLNLSRLPFLMPLGLSFYLFSYLSCIFDVYRNQSEAPSSLIDFGLYAAFFGRVNMGPIGSWAGFKPQLDNHPLTKSGCNEGMALFLQGLLRKVILADNFYLIHQSLAGNTTWLGNLLFGFAYFFQLYLDFSGYSRMARGIGHLFGFEIPANFNLPYTALSIQDFWRRWHISLTDWFRKYVYIPLGGNRVDRSRWMFNIMAVWLLTGLWHGASWPFLVWGLYEGGLILLEQTVLKGRLDRLPVWSRHVYVVILALIGWTFFSNASLLAAFSQIGRYFGIGITGFGDSASFFVLRQSLLLFAAGIVLASGWSVKLAAKIRSRLDGRYLQVQLGGYLVIFLVSLSFLVSATSQTFLYAVF